MPPILEVTGLSVHRGRTAILREVSWRVLPREHWIILGANGSGKTSLLKALTGYLSPTTGAFSLLGRRYGTCDWRELRFKIGMVTSAFAASIVRYGLCGLGLMMVLVLGGVELAMGRVLVLGGLGVGVGVVQGEGKVDKAAGKAQATYGDAKEKVKSAIDKA